MRLLRFLAAVAAVCILPSAAVAAALPIGQDDQSPSIPAAGYRADRYHIHHADNSDRGNSDGSASSSPSSQSVQVDRFAQLIATHWQFDHLDTIKTACYDYIARQMRDHIEISVGRTDSSDDDDAATPPSSVRNQHPLTTAPASLSSSDVMDLDILRAQIFGAIQAHVGGRLPIMWDELGDKLGRPSIELYVRRLVLSHCRGSDDDDHVDHTCLVEYGHQILAEIDRYVVRHLVNLFDIMNGEYLEPLLQHTATDLDQVLAYFNAALFSHEDTRLWLHVLPWKQAEQRTHLYDFAASASNSPDHASDIIGYYANLSRI